MAGRRTRGLPEHGGPPPAPGRTTSAPLARSRTPRESRTALQDPAEQPPYDGTRAPAREARHTREPRQQPAPYGPYAPSARRATRSRARWRTQIHADAHRHTPRTPTARPRRQRKPRGMRAARRAPGGKGCGGAGRGGHRAPGRAGRVPEVLAATWMAQSRRHPAGAASNDAGNADMRVVPRCVSGATSLGDGQRGIGAAVVRCVTVVVRPAHTPDSAPGPRSVITCGSVNWPMRAASGSRWPRPCRGARPGAGSGECAGAHQRFGNPNGARKRYPVRSPRIPLLGISAAADPPIRKPVRPPSRRRAPPTGARTRARACARGGAYARPPPRTNPPAHARAAGRRAGRVSGRARGPATS